MAGLVWQIEHHSVSLHDQPSRNRKITVAIPGLMDISRAVTVYCTDGQVVETLAAEFERVPFDVDRPILIGVHSHPTRRAQEYLLGSTESFLDHEQFVVNDVRSWAEAKWGISADCKKSVLFGFSNGGAFALTTALQHGDRFAAVIALSVPPFGPLPIRSPPGSTAPLIYMAAGNRGPERSIQKHMLKLRRSLQRADIAVEYHERDCGHTLDFWSSELVTAIQWLNRQLHL